MPGAEQEFLVVSAFITFYILFKYVRETILEYSMSTVEYSVC